MIQLIADIGVNFSSLAQAERMVAEVAKSADFVKFQLFNEETIKDYAQPLKDRLKPLILTELDVMKLKATADKAQIGFILTPMYLDAVKIAKEYCGEYIKIRFADNQNQKLIDAVLATGKKVLISVPRLPTSPALMYHPQIRFMYNIPKYPPEIEDFNLDVACTCSGFSSHFTNPVCDLAWAINRTYNDAFLEKHVMFTGDSYLGFEPPIGEPIDSNVSINFQKLANLKSSLMLIERMQRIRL